MTVYGVTPAGFVIKPPSAIVASMTARILQLVAADTDVAPDQPLGQVIGIVANELSSGGWEIGQVAYNATNRGDAEGDLLDNIGGLTGTVREGETPSTVPCSAAFSAAGFYAAGSLVAYAVGVPAQQWSNVVGITVPATSNDGSGQPISFTHQYTATGVTWASSVDGPTYGDALSAAEELAGEPQLIETVPVAGWVSITDAGGEITLGTLEELDPPYRLRQYQELSAPGSSTLDAIGAKIIQALATVPVAGVIVQVYENTSLTTDGNGQPAKSFQAVVYDGPSPNTGVNNPLIAGAIWNNKPAGMLDYGATTVSYLDALGIARNVSFTRPTRVPIYLAIEIATADGTVSSAQISAITVALISASQGQPFTLYGTTFTPGPNASTSLVPGADLVVNALKSIVQGQAGVLDVPLFKVGTSYPATGTANLSFSITQVATIQGGADLSSHLYITITATTLSP